MTTEFLHPTHDLDLDEPLGIKAANVEVETLRSRRLPRTSTLNDGEGGARPRGSPVVHLSTLDATLAMTIAVGVAGTVMVGEKKPRAGEWLATQ
jgi:hypothetical protein